MSIEDDSDHGHRNRETRRHISVAWFLSLNTLTGQFYFAHRNVHGVMEYETGSDEISFLIFGRKDVKQKDTETSCLNMRAISSSVCFILIPLMVVFIRILSKTSV